jgi:hypothetical protein
LAAQIKIRLKHCSGDGKKNPFKTSEQLKKV